MSGIPAYKVIQQDILDRITSGALVPGDKIATEAELMAQYGVSRITAQRAVSELKQRGVLMRKPRAGSFVARVDESPQMLRTPDFSAASQSDVRIAVVAPFDMELTGTYRYLNGIMSALNTARDNVTLHNTRSVAYNDRVILEGCLKSNVSGILYYPSDGDQPPMLPPVDLLLRISAYHVPCVLIDKCLPGVPLPCVQSDNTADYYQLTRRALKLGHKKLCYLCTPQHTTTDYERYLGFCKALSEAGIAFENALYRCCDTAEYGALIQSALSEGVTCICCSTDYIALSLSDTCAAQGISVPGQLSITGFDGLCEGQIASMRQQYAQIGRLATELLIKWISTGEQPKNSIRMPAVYVDGSSLQ